MPDLVMVLRSYRPIVLKKILKSYGLIALKTPLPSLRSLRETDRSAQLNCDLLKLFNKIFPFQIFCLPLPSHYIYCTRVPERR